MAGFATVEAFLALTGEDAPTRAERKLIEACRAGKPCTLGDGKRPEEPDPSRRVRAGLLRLLITGATPGCGLADAGVGLKGGWITGGLVLDYARTRGAISLTNCTFPGRFSLTGTEVIALNLSGSRLWGGLRAPGLIVKRNLILRNGFTSDRLVNLTGAIVDGQLSLTGAVLAGSRYHDRASIAFLAQRLRVSQGLFWQDVTIRQGEVILIGAHASDLKDDTKSWPGKGRLVLDGFTYDRIATDIDVAERLTWLAGGNRTLTGEFSPQPYLHLAKVLRAQGHDRAAREILVEMEWRVAKHQKRADRKRAEALWWGARGDVGTHWLRRQRYRVWDWLFRHSTGYGYQPGRALTGLAGLFFVGTILNFLAFAQGGMAPASPVILASADWHAAMAVDPERPALVWLAIETPLSAARPGDWPGDRPAPSAAHYETFSAPAYTLDVLVPFLDIRQETAWAPSTATGLGTAAWVFHWVLKSLGWFLTAMGLTAATGHVRRKRE